MHAHFTLKHTGLRVALTAWRIQSFFEMKDSGTQLRYHPEGGDEVLVEVKESFDEVTDRLDQTGHILDDD